MDQQVFIKIKNEVFELCKRAEDSQHDFSHFERVSVNAEKIARLLKIESEIDLNLLKTCCYIHDYHVFFYRPSLFTHFFERHYLKKVLPKFLDTLEISEIEKLIVSNAVYNHPYSLTYGKLNRNADHYTKILQDADTIDYLSDERLASLNTSKKYIHYKIASFFAKPFIMYNRKKLKSVLNYPELSKYFYSSKPR